MIPGLQTSQPRYMNIHEPPGPVASHPGNRASRAARFASGREVSTIRLAGLTDSCVFVLTPIADERVIVPSRRCRSPSSTRGEPVRPPARPAAVSPRPTQRGIPCGKKQWSRRKEQKWRYRCAGRSIRWCTTSIRTFASLASAI